MGGSDLVGFAGDQVKAIDALRLTGASATAASFMANTLARLEQAHLNGNENGALGIVLAEARLLHSSIVADLADESQRAVIVRTAQRATQAAAIHGDLEMQARSWSNLGNRLRMAGQSHKGLPFLDRAVTSTTQPIVVANASAWKARAVAELGDLDAFDAAIEAARRALDRAKSPTKLMNETTLNEIEMRGRLHLGDLPAAIRLLQRITAGDRGAAPQWRVIRLVTLGEVEAVRQNIELAQTLFVQALDAAHELSMPHQIERIEQALQRTPHAGLRDLHHLVRGQLRQTSAETSS